MELKVIQINTHQVKDSDKRLSDCVDLLLHSYRKSGHKQKEKTAINTLVFNRDPNRLDKGQLQ